MYPGVVATIPPGSWGTKVWQNGQVIGFWLNYQFDPFDGFYIADKEGGEEYPKEQYRPIGTDTYVKPERRI